MEALFIFLVKSSGLIGMFYLSYIFLLRKETFFNSNRWYLLTGLISSVLMPLVVFTKIVWVAPSQDTFDWSKIPVTTTIENDAFEINWFFIFTIVYLIGIVSFLIKFVFDFYSLFKVLKGKSIQKQGNFKFIDVTENISPFSFFKYIVYNSSLYNDTEMKSILEHEKIHSVQNHTVDVLVSRVFCIVFWFNPFVWLYKKAIIQNLEFIADSKASKKILDTKAYQLTLLKITTHENCVAITNHFYQSLIKKRIIMLNKNQSNKRNSWKYAVALPLLGVFLFLFQVKTVAQEKTISKQENETKTDPSSKIEKDLITSSKEKEVYINGKNSSEEELAKIDPKEIEKIDIIKKSDKQAILVTTKDFTKPEKITSKDISIDNTKPTLAESSQLDQSTIDIIQKFDELDLNKLEARHTLLAKKFNVEMPLITRIFVDGKHMDQPGFKIGSIDPNTIKSFRVLRGKMAEEKYRYGRVIEILTKDNALPDDTSSKLSWNFKKSLIIIDEKESDYNTLKKLIVKGGKILNASTFENTSEENKERFLNKYGEKARNGVVVAVSK